VAQVNARRFGLVEQSVARRIMTIGEYLTSNWCLSLRTEAAENRYAEPRRHAGNTAISGSQPRGSREFEAERTVRSAAIRPLLVG
jgi:hypothetical protein